MDQRIGYCTSKDGTKIAYAITGAGPPLARTATWMTHIGHDLDHPMWRHWWRELSNGHTLVRYDQRGCGLSDRKLRGVGIEERVQDLEAVVDALGLTGFGLLGPSHGCPPAIAFAARHPERVSRLILHQAFAQTPPDALTFPGGSSAAHFELLRSSWERPATRRMFVAWLVPDASPDYWEAAVELLRVCSTGPNSADVLSAILDINVVEDLHRIEAPTLVLQSTDGELIPPEEARLVASQIPNARIAMIESRNHVLTGDEPGWGAAVAEIQAFLGAAPLATSPYTNGAQAPDALGLSPREVEVLRLVSEGKTDRAIALDLGISTRTASNHVNSILRKTGSSNRAQAAVWAARHTLV